MSVYDPSKGTTSNKSYAVVGKPVDFRTYYADPTTGIQRAFQNIAEVNAWFDTPAKRIGQFDIVINTGGTLAFGVITGGVNDVYYYKNGQNDSDLVPKFGASNTKTFLSTDTFPFVFDLATYPDLAPFFAVIPTLVLREDTGGGVFRYRNIDICTFDSGTDTLTINDVPFNGDITFKL